MYLLNEAMAREHSRELDRRASARQPEREAFRRRRQRPHKLRSAALLLRHRSAPRAAMAE